MLTLGLLGRGREAVSQFLIERFYMTSRPPPLISLQNDAGVWETSAKIPYWWRVAPHIWLVLLIGTSSEVISLKPVVVSRNVGCFLRHSCWPRERKRTIWIRYCHLNVLVFFSSHFALLLRTDDEGSEETMDTESQQKSTLSNDVYKQASVDFSSLFVFSHSTYRKPREGAIANYVIWLKSKTCNIYGLCRVACLSSKL